MTGWELPNKLGPVVCLVNGAVALGVFAWLVTTRPDVGADAFGEHPWLGDWMKGTALLAVLMPASTMLLWRDCPAVPLPPDQWPQGPRTPQRRRVRRGAPRGAKLALLGLVVHGLGLLALPFVALAAGSGV